MNKQRATAMIVETKHGFRVKITLTGRKIVWARRDPTGQIRYDHPESVPRYLKHNVVPALFKQIDVCRFGIAMPPRR